MYPPATTPVSELSSYGLNKVDVPRSGLSYQVRSQIEAQPFNRIHWEQYIKPLFKKEFNGQINAKKPRWSDE